MGPGWAAMPMSVARALDPCGEGQGAHGESVSKAGGGGSTSWGKGIPCRLGWQLWGEDLKVPREQ